MGTPPLPTVPARTARRWFRFSLSALLVAIALLSVWLASVSSGARRQKWAVDVLKGTGVQLVYDYQVGSDGSPLPDAEQNPPGPAWLRNLVGIDYVANVVRASGWAEFQIHDDTVGIFADLPALQIIVGAYLSETGLAMLERVTKLRQLDAMVQFPLRPQAWQHLWRLAALERLGISGDGFDDDSLAQIGRMHQLRYLAVAGAPLTGEGLSNLSGLTDLEELQLNQCGHLDDAGLKHLLTLTHLRSISFVKSSVSDNAVDKLWRQMPNLKVINYSDGKSKTR
jgi:hypothetical protein